MTILFTIPLALRADEKRSARPALSSTLEVSEEAFASPEFMDFIKQVLAEKGGEVLKHLWLNGKTLMPATLSLNDVMSLAAEAGAAGMMDAWRSMCSNWFIPLCKAWLFAEKGFGKEKIEAYEKNYLSLFTKFPHGRTEISEQGMDQVKKLLALAREWEQKDKDVDYASLLQWASNKANEKKAVTVDMI